LILTNALPAVLLSQIDLSIHGPGRVRVEPKKIRVFRVEKIIPTTVPWDVSRLSFRIGPGLGRAARAFYTVK
jgi:hypothetical protein